MQYLPLFHFFTIKFHKDLKACGYVSNASVVLTFFSPNYAGRDTFFTMKPSKSYCTLACQFV